MIMHQPAPPIDALRNVKFQLSLLHISSLGAETPQAQVLESLLISQPRNTLAPKH